MHFFDESFWLAVSFIVFIYLSYRPVKKAILRSLDAKIEEVKKQVTEAEIIRKDAEDILTKIKIEITNLDQKRAQIIANSKLEADQIAAQHSIQMQAVIDSRKINALNLIEINKKNACDKIKKDFIALTTKLVTDYMHESNNNNCSDVQIFQSLTHQKQ
ncbi:MAG: ATP F0F1 synthase subunit B [Rickettsiaceae bacterium]|nr:MAG: ATP F0F1 synthase subunit B [Rickettsiaceae bacterium]